LGLNAKTLVLFFRYEMVYTNITQKGMSGSPVIDTGGRLIGIHAAAEGDSISINQETGEKREPNSVIAYPDPHLWR